MTDSGDSTRRLILWLPYLWLLLFFLAPFLIILKISLADPLIAQPPFTSFLNWADGSLRGVQATADNYRFLFEDKLYAVTYINSVKVAAISTLLCLLLVTRWPISSPARAVRNATYSCC